MTPTILLEDDWILAVDKPSGMAVHPGAGLRSPTLNDWVRQYLGPRATRNDFTASVVHRLDRETSGVVLVAKRRPAMRALATAFEQRQVTKRYVALVRGTMPASTGTISRPLPDADGRPKEASTHWEIAEAFSDATLLTVTPHTGRKHQIRQHLAGAGHPLAGDAAYGDASFNARSRDRWQLSRLFLHARTLRFPHPQDGRMVQVEAPLPAELLNVLARLRRPKTPKPS